MEGHRVLGRISYRAAAWLAWSLWALSVALTALSLVLLALIRAHPGIHVFDFWLGNSLVVIDATVGAVVASRRPENPVGWLLCLSGVATSTSTFTSQCAIYALLAQPNSLPAGEAMAWIAAWTLPIMNGVQVFYLLLFPTGRLPSRRWRWLAWLTVAYILVGVLTAAFSPGAHLGALGPIRNPLGIEGLTQFYKAVLYTMSPALFLAAAFSLVCTIAPGCRGRAPATQVACLRSRGACHRQHSYHHHHRYRHATLVRVGCERNLSSRDTGRPRRHRNSHPSL